MGALEQDSSTFWRDSGRFRDRIYTVVIWKSEFVWQFHVICEPRQCVFICEGAAVLRAQWSNAQPLYLR
jgi:hypothetical protein